MGIERLLLPAIGTRVRSLGQRLLAPDRFEGVHHKSGGDYGRYQVEERHGQHHRYDHAAQKNAPTVASPYLARGSCFEAPQRHSFIVFAPEKIAVQTVKYKEIQGR